MAEAILMPRLSDTMTEGVIAAWHKKVGDPVKKGDVLADVETDKATMELESYKDGTVLYLGVKDGQKLNVDDLLLIVGKEGEDYQSLLNGKSGGGQVEAPVKDAGDKDTRQPEQNGRQDQETDTKVAANGQTPEGKPAADDPTGNKGGGQAIDLSKIEEVVLMPRLSDTMTEGVIATWQKKVGDDVKKGDVLAEIETDKATMELESYKDGKLLYQGAEAGSKIQVNDLLCIIAPEGFKIDDIVAASKGGGASASKTDATEVPHTESPATAAQPQEKPAIPAPEAKAAPQPEEQKVINDGRILASPLAKKLAADKGIDLKYVQGNGDGGRITKADVEAYKAPAAQPAAPKAEEAKAPATPQQQPAKAAPQVPAGQERFEEVPVSQMRKVIARRLSESLFTAPHFYVTMSIDMDAAVAARTKINETAPVKISFNDIVLKAVAMSLKQHPKVNSSWLGDKIRTNYHINIGVAVAVDEGLLVPVVRFADTKSLSQISAEVKDFARKAKDKKLQPADWEGSTFTISNLGMFGVDEFTAIINPPDACILAVSGIQQVPVVKNGAVVPGNVMKVTLSCDHRVVDGATGAAFLQTVKSLLEEPLRMLV